MWALCLFASQQIGSGQVQLDALAKRLEKLHALSATLVTAYEGAPEPTVERLVAMTGGYLRYAGSESIAIVTPTEGWILTPKSKTYQVVRPAAKGTPKNPFLGMPGLFGENPYHATGPASTSRWKGAPVIAIPVAQKTAAKQTRLVFYVDAKTKLPKGFHAEIGGVVADGEYRDLRINPPVSTKDFEFVPPKGWKKYVAPKR